MSFKIINFSPLNLKSQNFPISLKFFNQSLLIIFKGWPNTISGIVYNSPPPFPDPNYTVRSIPSQ